MNDKKKSFLLLIEYQEVIETLSDEEAGQLIKAIYKYESTGEVGELSSVVKIAFIPIKNKLDENREKWEEAVQQKSEAGKKGMEKRWASNNKNEKIITEDNTVITENNRTITENNTDKKGITEITDYDNDFVLNDSVNDSVNDLKPPLSPFEVFSPQMQSKLKEWLQYKKERRETYKTTGLRNLAAQIFNKLKIYPEDEVIELIDVCMANNWKGIIWDKLADGMKKQSTSGNPFMDILRREEANEQKRDNTNIDTAESSIPGYV